MMTSTNGKPTSSEIVLEPKRRRIPVAEKIRILKAVEAAAPDKQGAVVRVEDLLVASFDVAAAIGTWRSRFGDVA